MTTEQNTSDHYDYTKQQKEGVFMLLQDVRDHVTQMDITMNRRLDDASAEVHATCQMIGMPEDSLKDNCVEVLGWLIGDRLPALPSVGQELEAGNDDFMISMV